MHYHCHPACQRRLRQLPRLRRKRSTKRIGAARAQVRCSESTAHEKEVPMSPRYRDIRDVPIFSYSRSDHARAGLFFRGAIILGDPDSGKSSTSRKQLVCAALRGGFGAFCCTTKPEDTADYVAYARECGRGDDVQVFGPDSGLSFDPIAHEWSRTTGRGAQDVETIVDYFDTLLSLGKNYSGGGDQRFFELASQQITRVATHVIKLAGAPLSIPNISRVISSFPNSLEEGRSEEWQKRSYTFQLLEAIEKREESLTKDEWEDLKSVTDFIFFRWATLDERPRSSIAMTFSGMSDRFLYNPTKKLFASGTCSFTPWQVTHEGKIIILDFPVNEMGKEGARLIQSMIKLTFQRDWLRHPYTPGCCNGALLVQDEFQLLITKFENHFAQTCRASGIACVYITQNILNLAEELGESQPGSKTRAFLGNIGTKIAHRCTCSDTTKYLSNLIGQEYRYLDHYSAGGSSATSDSHFTTGGGSHLAHIVEPVEFTSLKRPSRQDPLAEAIVYLGGDIFEASKTQNRPQGHNYLRVFFSRE
jgi:hypothetical protein